jgi:hypothetical protein
MATVDDERALKSQIDALSARCDFCESSVIQVRKDVMQYLKKKAGHVSYSRVMIT